VCGSAASWMLEHIVEAKGGLYHRVTKRILLRGFNLKETEEFLKKTLTIKLSKKQIADLYMVTGGIPFYLKEVKKGYSSSQLIDKLCFQLNGVLYSEFANIFRSLFDYADVNLLIIREIAKAGNLISREELIKVTGLSSGGTLDKRLEELIASEFIQRFVPLGKKVRDSFFRIIDEYTLFYMKWIEPLINTGTFQGEKGCWNKIQKRGDYVAWAGYAFESLCYKHVNQIAQSLDLDKISYLSGSWRYIPSKKSKERGAQIDLLFDRDDLTISLCEIKYSQHSYSIDKAYAQVLSQKLDVFLKNFPNRKRPTHKHIHLVMITPFGLKKNTYSEDLVEREVVLEDLFT
jgi:uncharacterized protein